MQPGQATILFLHAIGFLAGLGGLKPRPFRSGAPNRAARQAATHEAAGGRAQYREARGRASRGSRTVRFDSFRDPGPGLRTSRDESFLVFGAGNRQLPEAVLSSGA